MPNKFKQDKGVAGLTIFLSLVVMLFVIGLLIMIFSLMGSELKNSTYDSATSVSVVNETIASPTTAGVTLAGGLARDGVCATILLVNGTVGEVVNVANYTQTNCVITNLTGEFIDEWEDLRGTYTYTWSADNTATDVINDTTNAIAGTVDWFDIFVVIGAMVVLILLTVIIVTSIRSSGMIAGAGSTKGNSVGTA